MWISIYKRVLCCLLVLLVLCTCIVRPLTVKAVEPVTLGVGAAAVLIAFTAGVLFLPKTAEDIVAIGNSLTASLTQWADTEQKQADVTAFFADASGLVSFFPDIPKDPNAFKGLKIATRTVLAGLATWLCTVIAVGGVGKEPIVAPDGYAYYNGYLFPLIPDSANRYKYIFRLTDGNIYCFSKASEMHIFSSPNQSPYFYMTTSSGCRYILENGTWVNKTQSPYGGVTQSEGNLALGADILYSNIDVLFKTRDSSDIYLAGSEPSSVNVDVDLPSIYVGDFPNQVKNGEKDEEDVQKIIPPDISLDGLYNGQTTVEDFLSDTLDKLSSGQMTYDQYMDSISVPSDIVDPDPTVPGDDDDDIVSPPDVPEMLPYALNLTDFFPFCIPFDIYDFFSALIAAPEAPQFHWEIQDLSGRSYSIDIDLSCWDSLAATFRSMQLLLFIVGLAAASRKFIKW